MKKSEPVRMMDALQGTLRPLFKGRGFRMQKRTFNRKTADELTQVVSFQMGSFDPPGTIYVPGLNQNLYGKFTINLGIYVPEVAQYHGGGEAGNFVQEYHCCVRARIGELGPERYNNWWELREDEQLADEIRHGLVRDAFPFLDRFETRDAILNELLRTTERYSASSPPRIVCAIILAARGQQEEARTLLAAQIHDRQNNPRHPEYVRDLACTLGLLPLEA